QPFQVGRLAHVRGRSGLVRRTPSTDLDPESWYRAQALKDAPAQAPLQRESSGPERPGHGNCSQRVVVGEVLPTLISWASRSLPAPVYFTRPSRLTSSLR